MKEKIIARRYGEGFLGYAKDTIGLDEAVLEFKNLRMLFYQNPDAHKFLDSLGILYGEKREFIDLVFKGFSEEIRIFLKYILAKGRIKYIMDIADYIRVNYGHGEAVNALLKTTYPLDIELIERLKNGLEIDLKKKINFYLEIDPFLLGGIWVRIGNMVLDGSVRKRLDDLKEKLAAVNVN